LQPLKGAALQPRFFVVSFVFSFLFVRLCIVVARIRAKLLYSAPRNFRHFFRCARLFCFADG